MSHWTQNMWVAFDTETTGLDTSKEHIIEAAVVSFDPIGKKIRAERTILIDPEGEISEAVTKIHGHSKESIRKQNHYGPKAGIFELESEIANQATLLGFPLIIFNARYDLPLLRNECSRYAVTMTGFPFIIDPLIIDRELDKYRKGSRTLIATAQFYGYSHKNAHGARADCLASIAVLRGLLNSFPKLAEMPLVELYAIQKQWYSEWRDHRNAFYVSTGNKERIKGNWPLEANERGHA